MRLQGEHDGPTSTPAKMRPWLTCVHSHRVSSKEGYFNERVRLVGRGGTCTGANLYGRLRVWRVIGFDEPPRG